MASIRILLAVHNIYLPDTQKLLLQLLTTIIRDPLVRLSSLLWFTLIQLYSNIYWTRCNVTQFILSGNCSTCFGSYHHPSSGAQRTVSTAAGICHTVTAICRYRGRGGTGVCHPQPTQTGSNSSTAAADKSNSVTNTRCCRYSYLRSWWWVMVPPETCRTVFR